MYKTWITLSLCSAICLAGHALADDSDPSYHDYVYAIAEYYNESPADVHAKLGTIESARAEWGAIAEWHYEMTGETLLLTEAPSYGTDAQALSDQIQSDQAACGYSRCFGSPNRSTVDPVAGLRDAQQIIAGLQAQAEQGMAQAEQQIQEIDAEIESEQAESRAAIDEQNAEIERQKEEEGGVAMGIIYQFEKMWQARRDEAKLNRDMESARRGPLQDAVEQAVESTLSSFSPIGGLFQKDASELKSALDDVVEKHNQGVAGIDANLGIGEALGAIGSSLPQPSEALESEPDNNPAYDFSTPKGTQHWNNLRDARRLQLATQGFVDGVDSHVSERQAMVDVAELQIDVADERYVNGEFVEGDRLIDTAKTVLDAVFDFVPGVSLVKDCVTLATGVNPVTGESISSTERAILAATLLMPAAIAGSAKAIGKTAKILGKVVTKGKRSAARAADALDAIKKADDELVDLAGNLPCVR